MGHTSNTVTFRRRVVAGISVLALMAASAVDAQTQYWDGSGTTPGNTANGRAGSGTWNAGNTNWTDQTGSLNAPWASGAAVFAPYIGVWGDAENYSITVDPAGVSATGLTGIGAGTRIDFTGGGITLAAGSTIDMAEPDTGQANYFYFNNRLTGLGDLTKSGKGGLTLSADSDIAGALTVTGGPVQVNNAAHLAITNQLVIAGVAGEWARVTVAGGAELKAAGLVIDGPVTGSASFAQVRGKGWLDVGNGEIVVGDTRRGTLTIYSTNPSEQARVSAGTITLGKQAGSTGTLQMWADNGADSELNASARIVGGTGGGVVILSYSGNVPDPSIAFHPTLEGNLSVDIDTYNKRNIFFYDSAKTYTGQTLVRGGTLTLDQGANLTNSAVTVHSGGTLAARGNGPNPNRIAQGVTINNGGTLAGSHSTAVIGAGTRLTLGSLTLNEDSNVNVALGTPGNIALFTVTGDFTLNGKLNVTDAGGFVSGTYRLFDYGGALIDNGLIINSLPEGFNPGDWSIIAGSGAVDLFVPAAGTGEQYWDGPNLVPGNLANGRGGSGVWNATHTNWTNQAGNINAPWAAGTVVFGGAHGTVTVENAQSFTGMRFLSGGSSGRYQIVAGAEGVLVTETADTPITFAPATGLADVTFAAAITGTGGLHFRGQGAATFNVANSYTGATRIESGTVYLGTGGTLGSGTLTLDIDGRLDSGSSTALAMATIVNSGVIDLYGTGGFGNATVTNTADGRIYFESRASAGTAHFSNAGLIAFDDDAVAIGATIVNQPGALLDLSSWDALPDIGSLSGAGTIRLNSTPASNGVSVGYLNRDDEISGVIEDTPGMAGLNGLVKVGSGTLILSGHSTYAGTTQAHEGRLVINGSVAGDARVNTTGTLTGSGSIAGMVVVLTDGILEGRSGQTLTMGELRLNDNGENNSQINVALGAPGETALFSVTGNLRLDGTLNVTDAGGFGAGVYRIFDYGGTLTDNGLVVGAMPAGANGTVQTAIAHQINLVVDGSGPGPVPTTQFWNGAAAAADGTIHGGSGLWKASPTNWTDANGTAAVSWGGVFAVFQGAAGVVSVDTAGVAANGLQFAVDGYRIEGGTITLNAPATLRVGDGSTEGERYEATIASVITGTGGLIKTDLGRLTLTADSSALMGTSRVEAGILTVDGQLGGALEVRAGGRLQGTGTVGDTIVSGIIAPGQSIGTLNAGNITFDNGAIYEVEVNAAGQADLVNVHGTATINAGTVQVLAGDGNYAPQTRYTILTASGGRTGTFTSVTSNLAFLDPSLSYDANNVYLTMTRNAVDFRSAGVTANQIATGGGVESLSPGHTIYDAVLNLSTPQAQVAFDLLSGEIHASAKTVMIEDGRFVRNALNNRLRAASDAAGTSVIVWGQGLSAWGRQNSDGNATRLGRSTGGVLFGADAAISDTWRFGAAVGYSQTRFKAKVRVSSGTSDNYHVGVYGGTIRGKLAFRTGAAYSWYDISTDRTVTFADFGDRLKGDYTAGTAQIFGEIGYRIHAKDVAFEPFANLAYVNLHTDGFTEKGDAAALSSRSSDPDMTFTTLGLRASANFGFEGTSVTAKAKSGWRHAYGDVTSDTMMTFAAGGDAFSIGGVPIARNAAVVEAGLDFTLSPDAILGVSYSGQFGSGVTDQTFRANFSVKF